jgi:predicted nucleotidyltransferase component of viral defense system
MLTKNELKAYTDTLGYSLGQVELDYYQHVVLHGLYDEHNDLYFKGGTCLQKVYGIRRFSEDLDFNHDGSLHDYKETIKSELNTQISDEHSTPFGTSFKTVFNGILSTDNPQSQCSITYDFRENDTELDPKRQVIRPPYKDLSRYYLLALHEREILAEKIRAVMTRDQARDVYDIHELLLEDVAVDLDLVDKKLASYNMSFDQNVFLKSVEEKKTYYDEELSRLTDVYPAFDEVKDVITDALEDIG